MIKFISLGNGCWEKQLIRLFNDDSNNQMSDIFDWMKTFDFKDIIRTLKNNFDIFNTEDIMHNDNVIFNFKYKLFLPHENNNLSSIKEKYNRRYNRFKNYLYVDNKYIFIRKITKKEDIFIGNNHLSNTDKFSYTKENFDEIMKYLPKNSLIVLLCPFWLDKNIHIYERFILIENVINPGLLFHTSTKVERKLFKEKYKHFFNLIKTNSHLLNKEYITSLKSIIQNQSDL